MKARKGQGITIPLSQRKKCIKATGDSWWTSGQYQERAAFQAEARRRFPNSLTQQQAGPLLKELTT